jgi:hypothetical protein
VNENNEGATGSEDEGITGSRASDQTLAEASEALQNHTQLAASDDDEGGPNSAAPLERNLGQNEPDHWPKLTQQGAVDKLTVAIMRTWLLASGQQAAGNKQHLRQRLMKHAAEVHDSEIEKVSVGARTPLQIIHALQERGLPVPLNAALRYKELRDHFAEVQAAGGPLKVCAIASNLIGLCTFMCMCAIDTILRKFSCLCANMRDFAHRSLVLSQSSHPP